jgi:hypothetical protein
MSDKQKDLIREVFLRNGFKIKDGRDDLADYVYAAAHDLLQAVPAMQKEPIAWSGWGCQHPGKMPRLYGERRIAELNCDWENGDQVLYFTATPQPTEQPVRHDWDDQDKCRRCGDRDWYASATCTPKQQPSPTTAKEVSREQDNQ